METAALYSYLAHNANLPQTPNSSLRCMPAMDTLKDSHIGWPGQDSQLETAALNSYQAHNAHLTHPPNSPLRCMSGLNTLKASNIGSLECASKPPHRLSMAILKVCLPCKLKPQNYEEQQCLHLGPIEMQYPPGDLTTRHERAPQSIITIGVISIPSSKINLVARLGSYHKLAGCLFVNKH